MDSRDKLGEAVGAVLSAAEPNATQTAREYGLSPRTVRERVQKARDPQRVLLVPDTHIPFHDERAWKLMLDVARDFKPHTLVHLGDLADFYAVSAHSKDPARMQGFSSELEQVREGRSELDALGAKRKIFTEGNHEYRLIRYLHDKAPELAGLVSLDELLKLTENGWEHVPYRQHTKLGKLYLTHDAGLGGKYTTFRALEQFQHSVTVAHHHQLQYFVSGNAAGEYQVGAQFGWLGDRSKVDYLNAHKAAKWPLGFGIGWHDLSTDYVYLQPVPIVEYSVCVNGKIYR